jgi:hypothetical protein
MNLKRYVDAKTKVEKSQVVHSIVEHLRQSSAVGGFVKKNHRTGRYMVVSDQLAREKVGHALRDSLGKSGGQHRQGQDYDPHRMEMVKRNIVMQAEQTIFKSLDLYHGRTETGIITPDLNASLDVSQHESSRAASPNMLLPI